MLTPAQVADLLANLPETRLEILELLRRGSRPDGSIDFQTAIQDTPRYERAQHEAQLYAEATRNLLQDLKWST